MKKANAAAAKSSEGYQENSEVAVRSGLGLDALRERKLKEELERQAKREAARAKRLNEETKKDVEDQQQIVECEQQARRDVEAAEEGSKLLKYEAALIVRIACTFGAGGVWTKIAEARARGAEIPLDPRRVYLLAHPDKCPLEEASDATAILNAQRPPEMLEARARPSAAPSAASAQPARELSPSSAAREARMEARRRKAAGDEEAAAPRSSPTPASTAAASTATPTPQPSVAPAAEPAASVAEASATASAAVVEDDGVERRIDPEDKAPCTLEELRKKYASLYTADDIQVYWRNDCTPLPSAKPKPKAKSRRF